MTLKNLNPRERYILAATASVLALAALYALVIEPVAKRWSYLDGEIKRKTAALKKDSALVAGRKAISADYEKVAPAISPNKGEEAVTSEMMSLIENMSRNDACFLVNIKPLGSKAAGGTKELMIDVTAEGSMQQLSKFLYDIEHPRSALLKVRRFTISSKSVQTSNLRGTFLISKIIVD